MPNFADILKDAYRLTNPGVASKDDIIRIYNNAM
jgi:hypothetical protein